jgi:hypothetical protein
MIAVITLSQKKVIPSLFFPYQELILVLVPQKVAFASQGACNGLVAQLAKNNVKNKVANVGRRCIKFLILLLLFY